ncbi:MAG: CoA transferase [Actinobacteria bacterium]|nr:MAG: CoA transferase [Actinomycetota bacterium]
MRGAAISASSAGGPIEVDHVSPPLANIRVIELGRVLAGPFCGMLLADLGAEVIKVEPPGGDDARTFGPFVDGSSTYYRLLNRDKLGITLDLKRSDQLAVLRGLLERSDVMVENFRPGTLERLGLGIVELWKLNPRLVVVSITGFGQDGPLRALPAYDLLVQAMSGLMAATGPVGGGPTRSAVSLGDLVPGLYGALGAVAALYERQRTGAGRHVDVAMLDSLVSLLESVAMRALHSDDAIEPLGNDHALSAPFGTYRTADGEIAITIANDPLFVRFAAAVGRPEWPSDARFATDAKRALHRAELRVEIEAALAAMPSEQALARLREAGIPVGPLLGVRVALAHPQVLARAMVIEEEDGFRTIGSALKLGDPLRAHRPAPQLGEHQELIERWLAEPART